VRYDFETLAKLAQEHGDSFYLIHVDRFRANLREMLGAFRALHPRTSIGYSYKTNYTPLLCKLAHAEGCYAEVVSKLEYDLALRLGVPADRILFNGPLKSAAEIGEALLAGAVVNLDAPSEVDAVEALASERPDARLRVGVRCQFALEPGHESRFGIAAEGGDLGDVLARLRRIPGCELRGLHCHFSAHRGVEAFRRRVEKLVELARRHFPGAPPPSLDIGGGFFGKMPEELRAQFGVEVPGYADYARAVAPVLASAFPGSDAPELILEPGAGVVADAVEFVTRVAVLKRLGERRIAVTTGSIQNIRSAPSRVQPPVRVVRGPSGAGGPALPGPLDLTGYTCMEVDVLYRAHPGELRVGDFVVFGNVGAYTTVFKPPFIRAAPAMLAYSRTEDAFTVARRREELDDLLVTYPG
jgi:diaminopimelate decarboxylase